MSEFDVPDVCWTNTGYPTDFTFYFTKALDYISLVTSEGWLYDLETGQTQTVDKVLQKLVPHQTTVTAALIIRCIECRLFKEAHECLSKYDGDRSEIDKTAVEYGMVDDITPSKSLLPYVFWGRAKTSMLYFKHFIKENGVPLDLKQNMYWWYQSAPNFHELKQYIDIPLKFDLFTHKYIYDKPTLSDQFYNFLLEAKETIETAKEMISDDSV